MAVKREKRIRRFPDYLRIVIYQRHAPEAVALGVCIGLFVGLSPLYGVQMATAFLLALLLRASKIAAVLSVWVTNAFTAVPIYSFNYLAGSKIMGSPLQEKPFRRFIHYCVHNLNWENLLDEEQQVLAEIFRLSRGILLPMTVGGLAVAAVLALVSYPLVKVGVRRIRVRRRSDLQAKNRFRHGERE